MKSLRLPSFVNRVASFRPRIRDAFFFISGGFAVLFVGAMLQSRVDDNDVLSTRRSKASRDSGIRGNGTEPAISHGARNHRAGDAIKAIASESLEKDGMLTGVGDCRLLPLPVIRSYGLSNEQVTKAEEVLRGFHTDFQDEMARRMRREPRFDVPSNNVSGYLIEHDQANAEKWRTFLVERLGEIGGSEFADQMVDSIGIRSDYLRLGQYDIELRLSQAKSSNEAADVHYNVALAFRDPITGAHVSGLRMGLEGFNESYVKLFDLPDSTDGSK